MTKLCRLLILFFFAPASAFAQCVAGPALPVCQQTNPVITSPLTTSNCVVGGINNTYQATASGNVTSFYGYSTSGGSPPLFTASNPGPNTSLFYMSAGTAGTYTFVLYAISSTGTSAPTTITVTCS